MSAPLILAIDQGTSSTKCLVVDAAGAVVARGGASLGQSAPHPGWVEQDPRAIWASVEQAVAAALTPELAARVVAVGFSTQRESCVIWDRATGEPLTPLLSWQDQRTEGLCADLRAKGHAGYVRDTSGLPLDPMFSAAKAKWLLDRLDPDRVRAKAGEIVIGTVDSFLISRFGGEPVVEAGNASRMQLVDVATNSFDARLLDLFDIPLAALPRIVPSVGPFPAVRGLAPLPDGVPVLAVLADSHAALFAHGAYAPGPVKATQGTGSSVMGLLDRSATRDGATLHKGLCVTIAWWIDQPMLAFEGNIRSAGSTLVWAADLLGVAPGELADLAASVPDAGNVHLVPGFNGLGAPWWDGAAVATFSGFTLGSGRKELARAALESIAHQIADLADAVTGSNVTIDRLHVDGGPTRNDHLMQIEADLIGLPVERTDTAELSALGAAHLAGLRAGLFDIDGLRRLDRGGRRFTPVMDTAERQRRRDAWRRAVARSLSTHD
ncbi:FGGY family carbohydrate kinase [Methylobrevis pamukkalensis]|uniref:Glycerol kinase n=1 Tax=Methylobrevis pamukkalensis TaxID=1439726 RepID=A0A1E3H3H5_9HYPH|nr:FGGY family carbohydrate kinase [Methylobrevis pamukkalensis]ODN70695.1 Glycerol kinase [Methylobrevis pamukkalensis]